jgi:GrpB-like predicted nucleotidyltransferase (UPF0157 family)
MYPVLPYGDRGPFECLPYDERSPFVFQLVANMLQPEDQRLRLEHVGSTAVPGCPGKGYIDAIVLTVNDVQLGEAIQAVKQAGFTDHDFGQGYPGARGGVRFDGVLFRVHLQILPSDSSKTREMLTFRDLLKRDPQLQQRYVSRKRSLIASGRDINPSYTEGKSKVIVEALRHAHGDQSYE